MGLERNKKQQYGIRHSGHTKEQTSGETLIPGYGKPKNTRHTLRQDKAQKIYRLYGANVGLR